MRVPATSLDTLWPTLCSMRIWRGTYQCMHWEHAILKTCLRAQWCPHGGQLMHKYCKWDDDILTLDPAG